MNHLYQILVSGLLCLNFQMAFAHVPGGNDEFALAFRSAAPTAESINLNFELPLDGVVELHLYGDSGERVWYQIYSMKKGKRTIRLKRSGFPSGSGDTLRLKFKQSEHSGTIPLGTRDTN